MCNVFAFYFGSETFLPMQSVTDISAPEPGRVLFADDDRAVQRGLSALIRRAGFQCECVSSGPEAEEALTSGTYDVLLTDIQMTGNTQLELVERAAVLAPGLPVVVLTGNPTVETAARAVRLSIVAYLTKPPNSAELNRVLGQAVDEARQRRMVRSGREQLEQWSSELAELERQIRHAREGETPRSYFRIMLRQTIRLLTNLEASMALYEKSDAQVAMTLEYAAALRDAIDVLERTKQNFKSKELADLRYRLERLINPGPKPLR